MSKIKIMHMIWSMGDGGAQQVVLNYLRDFNNDPDIELKLYVYTEPTASKYDREIAEKGYNVVYLNNPRTKIQIPYVKRYFQRPISQRTWEKAIREYNPDIVHVHISALLGTTMPGIIKNNVPIKFDTLHSSPYRNKGRIKRIISDAFRNQGVIPVCVTEAQAEEAKEWYGITKYEVVRNGVDVEKIKGKCCSKEEARANFDLEMNKFVIIGVGRLDPIKKFSLLIEVFAHVIRINPNAVLLLAGEGHEKRKLQHIAKELGILDSVKFLGNLPDVTGLYCAADVLAVTSDTESSSLVAIEAQICGTRCVLSEGVPRQSILLNRTQRLDKGATPKDWCNALLDDSYSGTPFANIEDYEVHNISKKMKEVYLKYYSMYKENVESES